jgi:hypothetical protein
MLDRVKDCRLQDFEGLKDRVLKDVGKKLL